MKLYDHIKDLLKFSSEYRNSDKKLIWKIWEDEGLISNSFTDGESLSYESYLDCTSQETIRRTRQKVQADFPELRSDKKVQSMKDKKRSTGGNFVYHEDIKFTGKLFN